MKILSVNVGQDRKLENAKSVGKTGIYKQPVSTAVWVDKSGLSNDSICDVENHGDPDQAVYIYGAEDYEWWSGSLNQTLSAGTFGENITIGDLTSASFCIGDRLHIGELILEVTAPRIPCVTLAVRMDAPTFVKKFRDAERPGLYCRVLKEGYIQTGDEVTVEAYDGEKITILEMFRDFFQAKPTEANLRRYLAAPIAIRARTHKESQLKALLEL